jgi:hypothetical protein
MQGIADFINSVLNRYEGIQGAWELLEASSLLYMWVSEPCRFTRLIRMKHRCVYLSDPVQLRLGVLKHGR